MAQDVKYLFYLFALLIIVAYFVGAATETNSLVNGLIRLSYAATGRTAAGTFAAYPSGGGTVQGG